MFPSISKVNRRTVALAVITIGALAAGTVYLLQTEKIALGAGVAGFLATALALGQWGLSQAREDAKIRWEAVRAYYEQRDEGVMLEVASEIFAGKFSRANIYCNFFEKWGRLVQMDYLPHEIFDGSSGVHIVNAMLKLEPFLTKRRSQNPLYANSFLSLVQSTVCKPEVRSNVAQKEVDRVLKKLMPD